MSAFRRGLAAAVGAAALAGCPTNLPTGGGDAGPCGACPTGETCETLSGRCRCSSGSCPTGQTCDPATSKCVTRDPCAGVSCFLGEGCNPTTGRCECSSNSCPSGQVCTVDRRCTSPLCTGVTCNAGEACNPANGRCECSASTCPSGQVCDSVSKRCGAPCGGSGCAPGEACVGGRCECSAGTCPSPQVCDTAAKRCVTPPCAGVVCRQGETCNVNTNTCECSANSCPAAQACDATRRCVPARCANVTCNAGETCNGTSGACECTFTSCPAGQRCDASRRCASLCTGVVCNPGEACSATTGACECSSTSCPSGQSCNAQKRCTSALCTAVTCNAGETCNPSTGTCECTVISCPSGQKCDASRRCVNDPCAAVSCNAGETCNPSAVRCECTATSCPAGQYCNSSLRCAVDPCVGLSCPVGETCDRANGTCKCSTTAPGPEGSCSYGLTCDPSTLKCVFAVGRACAQNTQCGVNGVCIPQRDPPIQYSAGYCSVDCAARACPSGSSCQVFSTVSRCFKDCTADGQCRTSEDYLCERVTTASLNKGCYPASSNTAGTAIGGACAKDHDCFYRGQCFPEIRGGQPTGWTGGYCLRYGCRLDGFCPAGALCGDDVCYASCVTSAGCRTQYHCAGEGYAAKICAPASALTTALVGTECTANTDCGTNGVCYRGVSEGYCTGFCSADRVACPTGSGCVDWTPAAGSVYSLCFRECSAANTSCGRPDLRCELGAGAFFGKCVNTCSTTQACPSGSICDGANCRANCTASATCTSDHHCAGIGAVGTANCYPRLGLAGINVGAGCVAATDCTGGDGRVCITYTGGYCSGFCSVDAVNPRETCPTGSRCVAYTNVASGRQYSLCFKSCQNNADCGRPDHRCELSGTFLGTCVKNCTPSDAGTSTECGAGWACSQVPGSTGFACQP